MNRDALVVTVMGFLAVVVFVAVVGRFALGLSEREG